MRAPVARPLLAVSLLLCLAGTAGAGEFGRVIRGLAAPLRAAHRHPPATPTDPCVEELADRIDWLETHLRTYGTIVAKQPDVWGQGRLTRHRVEYEEQMRRQLGMFTERTSAALRRSDQAFLGLALAVQSASGRRPGAQDVAVPDAAGSNNVFTTIQGLLPTTNEGAGRTEPAVIARAAPFAVPAAAPGFPFDDEPLALEPTVHLDQLSRYLQHLHALRRVNEGDDTADAPGYALNLVRIPVSIVPGGRTRRGHGAEITVIAEPRLGDDLLPTTFRNLVINDLVDIVAPALTWCVNDPDSVAWAATIAAGADEHPKPAAPGEPRQGVMAAMQSLRARLPAIAPSPAPSVKTRRARLPIPASQLADVAGIGAIAILVHDTRAALANHPANDPCIDYLDVRAHLAEELDAAYDFLALDDQRHVWQELPAWNLGPLVRGRRGRELAAIRCRFFSSLGGAAIPSLELVPPDGRCCDPAQAFPDLCRTTTAVLAWGILVESALLNDRLVEDMREVGAACGHGPATAVCAGPFHGPDPTPEARAAFADYVRRRWPIRVFALDPVTDEQNVDDSFARRREMQIALATASASGRLSVQALARYTRRLETDLATVSLNRTAVGFSHGADTFGWRFHPRVQSPPTRGTLATLGETIRGGPTTDGDLAQRQLEEGQRECVAVLVVPSFVPSITFDVRTTWFPLVHPRAVDPAMRQTLVLSRAVKAMQASAHACCRGAHNYRDGEVVRMLRRVDQLERELPLQTLDARIPQENTAGGFELFSAGVTDLAPELLGWYGAPGIDPDAPTSLFLVGKGFSVHDTSVVAGGRPARFTLLSREVLRVDVPAGVATIPRQACPPVSAAVPRRALVLASAAEPLPAPADDDAACLGCAPSGAACGADCNRREVVDIHLATPYGVSSHLLVPVARSRAAAGGGPAFDAACRIDLTFAVAKSAGTRSESARVDEFFAASCDAITIVMPGSFIPPPKAALRLVLRDAATGATAAMFSFPDPPFDAQHSRYVIAGGDLRNFVGDTSRPATDRTLRGAVKPYLDSLLARGAVAEDGDTVAFTLSAALVAGEHEVPIGGSLAVQAVRRGRTNVDPSPDVPEP